LLRPTGRMLLAFAFVFSESAWGAQSQDPKENPVTATKAGAQQAPAKASAPVKGESEEAESAVKQNAPQVTASAGGAHEGIKVHGHWTIELRNPDGSIATHREFENSLVTPNSLAYYLARGLTPGRWNVFIGASISSPSLDPCAGGTAIPPYTTPTCVITESDSHVASLGASNAFPTLSVSAVGNGGQQVQLTGSAKVPSNGQIMVVRTYQEVCTNTFSPSACNGTNAGSSIGGFTAASVTPTINVSAGQTIAVTVVISFS